MTTKRDIINEAFNELGLGSYDYDLQPEDYESAISRLDSIMAEAGAHGFQTGYPLSTSPDASTLDNSLDIILPLKEWAVASLAVRLAPSYGKTPSPDTKIAVQRGLNLAHKLALQIPTKRANSATVPAGAGYRHRQYPYLVEDAPSEILPEETSQ